MTNMENGRDYLQHVLNCLCTRLAQIDQAILEGEKEVEDMHEYYWENYTEMDEYGYENYDNQQALFHQMHANEEQFLLRKRFKKMLDSPFFGRVRFCCMIGSVSTHSIKTMILWHYKLYHDAENMGMS